MQYEKYLKGEEIVEFEKMLTLLRKYEKDLEKEKDPQRVQLWLLLFYLYRRVEELEKKISEMEDKRTFLRNILSSKTEEDIKKALQNY